MANRSFFEALDSLLTPVQQAEATIKADDSDKLRQLLNQTTSNGEHVLTDGTLVNQQAKETLLHFAVHQDAARCVALMCGSPFHWSPDRPNLVGRTPLQLVESRGYLPVWYAMAALSDACAPTAPLRPSVANTPIRSVSALLIYPHVFVAKPMNAASEVTGPIDQLGSSVTLLTDELSLTNLALLFELCVATPEVLQFDTTHTPLQFWSHSSLVSSHPSDCSRYPLCLLDHLGDLVSPHERLQHMFDRWHFHRLQSTTPVSSASTRCFTPPRLSDVCRLCVRRVLIHKLVQLTQSLKSASMCVGLNYPRLVACLPLPPMLHAFLGFRELWPAWPRHTVSRPSGRSRVYDPLVYREFIDVWFPHTQ